MLINNSMRLWEIITPVAPAHKTGYRQGSLPPVIKKKKKKDDEKEQPKKRRAPNPPGVGTKVDIEV